MKLATLNESSSDEDLIEAKKVFPITLLHAIMLFLVVAFASIFFTVYFFFSYESENILQLMSNKIISSKGESVKSAINYYVDIPRQANSIISHALQENELTVPPLMHVRSEILNVMQSVFADNSYLWSTAFGSIEGDYVGIARKNNKKNQEYLTLKSAETNNALTFYYGTSEASGIEDVYYGYNMFVRPWYADVSKHRHSSWTQAYRDMNSANGVSISFSSPVYNKNGMFTGVVTSDLHLSELNKYLYKLKPFSNSTLLILNENNQIISASDNKLTEGEAEGRLVDQKGMSLPSIFHSASPYVRAAGALIKNNDQDQVFETIVNGQRNFVLIMSLGDESQLSGWKGIIIVPEGALMHEMTHYRHLALLICVGVFSLGLLLILIVIFKVISPLRIITLKASNSMNLPWVTSLSKWNFPEIVHLDRAFYRLSQKVTQSIFALESQINKDPSSGLMTRAGLLKRIEEDAEGRFNLIAVVHAVNMTTISNSLGSEHAVEYLNELIQKFKKQLPNGTLICRDAIDKLIFIFPGNFSGHECLQFRNRIAIFFGEAKVPDEEDSISYLFTGKVGMVRRELTSENIISIIMDAYIALKYAQKYDGVTVQFYEESMREDELENIRLHECLRNAIFNNEFHLVLQPIVDLNSGLCKEGECLIRWISPELGFVPPDRFISLAEETGLMIPLGKWIINNACKELSTLIANGACDDFKLHINISATQLLQPDFSFQLLDAIKNHKLMNSNICIEITETVLLTEIERTSETLAYLRSHGVSVAIDDFGSGFSSLSYLHKLPFDTIKIDRDFVSGVLKDRNSESIISAVVVLANGFDAPLIAEGIEDENVSKRLIELGCTKAQGYYFRRPEPFSNFMHSTDDFILAKGN